MKRNKILTLVMTCFMGLTIAAPVFAQTYPVEDGILMTEQQELTSRMAQWSEEDMLNVTQFVLDYDKHKHEGNAALTIYLREQFYYNYLYKGKGERTPLVQAIIQQDVETFITLYDELMNGDKKISEKLEILRETLSQFEIYK